MAGSNRGWASAIGGAASDKATEPRMGMVHARMTALRSIAASPPTNEPRQSSSGAAVRPTLERFYQSLSGEQKARFSGPLVAPLLPLARLRRMTRRWSALAMSPPWPVWDQRLDNVDRPGGLS